MDFRGWNRKKVRSMSERVRTKKSKLLSVFISVCAVLLITCALTGQTAYGEYDKGDSWEELTKGLYLKGPERVFDFESPIGIHVTKPEWENDRNAAPKFTPAKIHYDWYSDNPNVAVYQNTQHYVGECALIGLSMAEERHFFKVAKGSTRIYCRITDTEGHVVTLSKQITVVGGKAIKSLSIDDKPVRKSRLYSTYAPIYTNSRTKKAKVKCIPMPGWNVNKITSFHYTKKGDFVKRDITKSKKWSLKDNASYPPLEIELVETESGQKFKFNVSAIEYKVNKLSTKAKPGSGVVRFVRKYGLIRSYTQVLKFSKNAKPTDSTRYRSRKDLVRKMIKYYDVDPEAISIKGKSILVKCGGLHWVYAKNSKELKKKAKVSYWDKLR